MMTLKAPWQFCWSFNVLLILVANTTAGEERPIRLFSEETRLVDPSHSIVKSVDSDGLVSSPDAKHLAYVAQQGERQIVALDGIAGKPYDWIQGQPVFSPDSRRLAYVAARIHEDKVSWHLVVDGVEGKGYDGIIIPRSEGSAPSGAKRVFQSGIEVTPGPRAPGPARIFSPDSRRVAYIAIRDVQSVPVVVPPVASGFVVAADGYLVTCAQPLRGAAIIQATVGGKSHHASLLANDDAHDLALLKVDARDLPALTVGDSDPVAVGDDVRILSYPVAEMLGQGVKIMRGVVTGRVSRGGQNLIESDTVVNPGSSGGPLVNGGGQVIGIVNSNLAGGDAGKVGLAVPSSILRAMLRAHGVDPGTPAAPAKLGGGELFKKVAPSIVMVSAATPADLVGSNPHRRARQCIVVDGVEGSEHNEIFTSSVTFCRDGSHLAYGALINSVFDNNAFVVVDGKPQGQCERISHLSFSPDGKRLAYVADVHMRQRVVLDGKESKDFLWVGAGTGLSSGPVFSLDSTRLAYVGLRDLGGYKFFTVVHGPEGQANEIEIRDGGIPGPPVFSPDGRRLAYAVSRRSSSGSGINWRIVVDNREEKAYHALSFPIEDFAMPVFSPDSRRLAYSVHYDGPADQRECWRAVVDGREEKEYQAGSFGLRPGDFSMPLFSPDSKHVAYRAARGGSSSKRDCFIVRDGVEGKHYGETHFVVFSPDSSHMAYVASAPGVMVQDGKEGKKYDRIGTPVFSPDSRHLAYFAGESSVTRAGGNRPWRLVVDGVEGKDYDYSAGLRQPPPPAFDGPDALHFLAGTIRVDVKIITR
jgi:Tol biopolymer transport system component